MIEPWNSNPPLPFNACGVLVQGTGCLLFVPDGGLPPVILENYGPFVAGDSVCVHGMLAPQCQIPLPCIEATACVVMNTIDPWGPPPGPQFHGAGVLIQGANCVLFKAAGQMNHKFTLANYGSCSVGDSVWVDGTLAMPCSSMCTGTMGCIVDNTIQCLSLSSASLPDLATQNYPNPFNPTTTISFALPQSGQVTVSVYNSLGQVVKVISDGMLSAGSHQVVWDGTDKLGHSVSSGVYFYRIDANGLSETRKMLLMK